MTEPLLPVPGLSVPQQPVGGGEPAEHLPVARVLVAGALPHLDRLFDYLVPADLDERARPGVRVTVPMAGRTEEGWITERVEQSEHAGRLSSLRAVVSPVPVLTERLHALCRRVAAHYGGTVADVVRLALPARHASVEKAWLAEQQAGTEGVSDAREGAGALPAPAAPSPGPAWRGVAAAAALLQRISAGEAPGAAWVAAPSAGDPAADWAHAFCDLAVAAHAGGRGALLLVPDEREVEHLLAVAATREESCLGEVVRLTAADGPRARAATWLRVLDGRHRIVVGTRSAAFAPVRDLGVVAWWDDADDSWIEPRTPHPHTRQVAALRAELEGAALVAAGPSRTLTVQQWVEQGRLVDLEADPATARRLGAGRHVAGEGQDAERDAGAHVARIPSVAWQAARRGLETGPVLVQVPRTGFARSLRCAECRREAGCPRCPGRLGQDGPEASLACRTCGETVDRWECTHCGGQRLRWGSPGTARTVHDLGRAFPGVPVRQSTAASPLHEVDAEPALVIATPGCEPRTPVGWAAVLLLDGAVSLELPLTDAEGEAMRRWSSAAADARRDGAGVVLCGVPAHGGIPAVEAFVRHTPGWLARQQLAERRETRLPPAVSMVHLLGHRHDVVGGLEELAAATTLHEVLGPVPVGVGAIPARWGLEPEEAAQAWVRAPHAEHEELARAVHHLRAHRSARRAGGHLLVTVDPDEWLAP